PTDASSTTTASTATTRESRNCRPSSSPGSSGGDRGHSSRRTRATSNAPTSACRPPEAPERLEGRGSGRLSAMAEPTTAPFDYRHVTATDVEAAASTAINEADAFVGHTVAGGDPRAGAAVPTFEAV